MLDPDDLTDLTIIVALADHLAGPDATDYERRTLPDDLVAMIKIGAFAVEVRNGIHDGHADTYLAVTTNGELRTISIIELDLPDDLEFEW